MKKIILLFILIIFVFANSQAQINKGSLLLGGDLSGFSEKNTMGTQEYNNNGFLISPLIGKAFKTNSVQGLYFSFGYNKNEPNNIQYDLIKNNLYGAGVFSRNYKPIKGNFYGFLQENLFFNYTKNRYERTSLQMIDEYKQTTIGINITPGLSFKVSKKLHLEAGLRELVSLNYSIFRNRNFTPTSEITSKTKRYSFSSSLDNFSNNLYFGFRLLLDKK